MIAIQVHNLNIVRNLDTLNLTWIKERIPRKQRTKYFIVCEEEIVSPAENKLMQIFSNVWKKQVLNAVVIYWNRTLSAVSFTPFPELKLMYIPNTELNNIKLMFCDKTQNLYGHPFRVTAFYDSSRARFEQTKINNLETLDGADGLLLRLIIEKMNATLKMSVPDDGLEIGELFPNKTATGCLADLISGNYDMGLNIRFYRLTHFEGKVEATRSNGRDDICFLVPRKGKAADIANIFRPFHKYTWISLVVSVPCYVSIFFLLVIRQSNKRSFQYHFFQFYAYLIQQPATFLPKSRRQRILIGFWLIGVLLLSFMYQGKLSGTLIIPKDQPEIDNIEELANSNLKIMSFSRYNRQIQEFFSEPKYNDVYQPLFKKLINCTIDEFYTTIAKLNPTYGFANKFHINVHLRRVYTQTSSIFFHQIKQCPVPFLGVYGIRYGTPYKGRINFIIRQAQECGLIDRWEQNNKITEQKAQAKLHNGHGNIPFSLLHLQTAFYVYFLGCMTAIAVFFCESFLKYFQSKQPNSIDYFRH